MSAQMQAINTMSNGDRPARKCDTTMWRVEKYIEETIGSPQPGGCHTLRSIEYIAILK